VVVVAVGGAKKGSSLDRTASRALLDPERLEKDGFHRLP
jgi:hypothetical protein